MKGFYTAKGLELAAKIAAGTKLVIEKVSAGSGTGNATEAITTALANERQTLTTALAAARGQTATLAATLVEASAPVSYVLTELYVFAVDPDDGVILYQVFPLDEPRAISAGGENTYRFYLQQTVGADGITVICSPAGILIDEDLAPLRTELAKKPDAVKEDIEIHVAKTGNDSTGDGSEVKPYLTIQKAVNSLPKLLAAKASIIVHVGYYDEEVFLYAFSGHGITLMAAGGEAVSIRIVDIVGCTCHVKLKDLTISGNSSDGYNWSLLATEVSQISLDNITCTETVSQQSYGALRFLLCPFARINDSVISNKQIAVDATASTVYLVGVSGSSNSVAIRSGSGFGGFGGYVQKGMDVTIAGEEQKQYGGQIW